MTQSGENKNLEAFKLNQELSAQKRKIEFVLSSDNTSLFSKKDLDSDEKEKK